MSTTLPPVEITADGGEKTAQVYVEIGTVQVRREPDVFSGERRGLSAHIKIATEPDAGRRRFTAYSVSRLVGETSWGIDATFLPNGFPQHANGFGARYLKVRALDPGIAALLKREAVRLGLAPAIAADVPLVLPSGN
jgi:hypothetical protein